MVVRIINYYVKFSIFITIVFYSFKIQQSKTSYLILLPLYNRKLSSFISTPKIVELGKYLYQLATE